jgi:hypothetical protein
VIFFPGLLTALGREVTIALASGATLLVSVEALAVGCDGSSSLPSTFAISPSRRES